MNWNQRYAAEKNGFDFGSLFKPFSPTVNTTVQLPKNIKMPNIQMPGSNGGNMWDTFKNFLSPSSGGGNKTPRDNMPNRQMKEPSALKSDATQSSPMTPPAPHRTPATPPAPHRTPATPRDPSMNDVLKGDSKGRLINDISQGGPSMIQKMPKNPDAVLKGGPSMIQKMPKNPDAVLKGGPSMIQKMPPSNSPAFKPGQPINSQPGGVKPATPKAKPEQPISMLEPQAPNRPVPVKAPAGIATPTIPVFNDNNLWQHAPKGPEGVGSPGLKAPHPGAGLMADAADNAAEAVPTSFSAEQGASQAITTPRKTYEPPEAPVSNGTVNKSAPNPPKTPETPKIPSFGQ